MEDPATYNTQPLAAIYLDYQASTPLDPDVFEAMRSWFLDDYGNPHSNEHAFGWRAQRAVETAREQVANCVSAEAEAIVFTSGATESNNLVLFGVAARRAPTRDTIIVSAIEHSSVLESARELERRGLRVIELAVDREGSVRLDLLDEALTDRVLLVSIGAVNNEIGTFQDLGAIGDRCRAVGALFHTDAAQALTTSDLQLGLGPVDFASLASHKAYGPKGIGALYIASGVAGSLTPMLYGGGQQRGLRAGTLPTPLCVGFGTACAKLKQIRNREQGNIRRMRDDLLERLRRIIPGLSLNGPALRHAGNLNIRLDGVDTQEVVHALQPRVACSTGSACHSGSDGPSHVLIAIGLSHEEARASLRLSLGRFTTDLEVAEAAEALAAVLSAPSSRAHVLAAT